MEYKVITTTVDALNKSLDAPALDPVLLSIANDYLAGNSIDKIADEYGISADRVSSVIEKREVKQYIDNVYATQGYLNRGKRIALINKVIEQKVTDALETGIYSKKDLLDWMKHLQEIENALKPVNKGPAIAIQVNNYERLMKELIES